MERNEKKEELRLALTPFFQMNWLNLGGKVPNTEKIIISQFGDQS
jgi:hypothetical protein